MLCKDLTTKGITLDLPDGVTHTCKFEAKFKPAYA